MIIKIFISILFSMLFTIECRGESEIPLDSLINVSIYSFLEEWEDDFFWFLFMDEIFVFHENLPNDFIFSDNLKDKYHISYFSKKKYRKSRRLIKAMHYLPVLSISYVKSCQLCTIKVACRSVQKKRGKLWSEYSSHYEYSYQFINNSWILKDVQLHGI